MSHRRLPVSLRDKITKYYEHRFQGKLFDEEKILTEVSRPLRKVGTTSIQELDMQDYIIIMPSTDETSATLGIGSLRSHPTVVRRG